VGQASIMSLQRFDQKVVLITGAATGIGNATVQRLCAEEAIVCAGILDSQRDAELHGATPVVLDVTDEEQWQRAVDEVVSHYGRLDVLVNNAGIRRSGLAEETTLAQWQHIIDTNLKGTFLGCRAVIPIMREQGGGAIVNVSSITGIQGTPRMVAYSASKSGIVTMTASLAIDHAQDNIRINAVCPGAIDTGLLDDYIAEADDRVAMTKRIEANHPMGRIGRPEEVASVIAFLASDDASFMTGLAIPVDGGRSVR
jgi:meso-butanediol dehydrogenase/(S,S)-butanediol dehydrogenase/diacetyl reductase